MDAQTSLARAASTMSFEAADDIDRAALHLLLRDGLACMVAGSRTPEAARVREAMLEVGHGAAGLVGVEKTGSASVIAYVNAHAGHILEFDDVHAPSIYHPGIPAIAAALAVVERCGSPRKRLADAVLAGYEVGIRVGEAAGTAHYQRHHMTGTVGCLGAAAAAARAQGLDENATSHALAHAATQAAALWAFRGASTDTKPLHSAHAAMVGVISADLARAGLTGAATSLEGPSGFFETLGGNAASPSLDVPQEPHPLRIRDVSIKVHACCGHTHSAITAAGRIREDMARTGLGPNNIAGINLRTYSAGIDVAGSATPQNVAELCFSYPYILAGALCGNVDDALSQDALSNGTLAKLAGKVILTKDPTLDDSYPASQPAHLAVRFTDGTVLNAEASAGPGSPAHPVTSEQHARKIAALAGDAATEIDLILAHHLPMQDAA